MPTKQYCDYIAEQEARRVRIEQQFPYKPVKSKRVPFWMHSIDRYEKAGETERIAAISILIVVVVLTFLLYVSTR